MKILCAMLGPILLAGAATMAVAEEQSASLPREFDPVTTGTIPGMVVGNIRSVANKAMDVNRHPFNVMVLFGGMRARMSVVEIQPTDNYWSEFLGGVLTMGAASRRGHFIQVVDQADKKSWDARAAENAFLHTEYGENTELAPLNADTYAEADSADIVLMSRKMAGLMRAGVLDKVLAYSFKTLKAGGTLIIEDYRAGANAAQEPKAAGGDYVSEEYAIAAAQKAGFKLANRDDVLLANPKDAKKKAAADSDRFLLKFTK